MTLDRFGRCAQARLLRATLPALAALMLAAPAAFAGYTLVDLGGVLGESAALSIGADGTIVGYELLAPFTPHATLFVDGHLVDLGTLGGDASLAQGAASGGRAVGWARLPDATRHAFLYEDGSMRDLGTLGGLNSQAFAVNDAGTVVGSSWLSDNNEEVPMMWTPEAGMVALPVPQVHGGQALGINAAGQVVGYFIDSMIVQPFTYSHGVATQLQTLGGAASKAFGISRGGLIVGYALTPSTDYPKFHAVYWRNGVIHDLGAMAAGHGSAYGINDAGTAVGFSYDADFIQIAVRYTQEGNLDLNDVLPRDSPWHLSVATDISEDGIISGIGVLNGETRGFALVPDGVNGAQWGLTSNFSMRAWPQPMHDTGTIELTLDRPMHGPLRLYDVSGRRLGDLAGGPFARGMHTFAVPGGLLSRLHSGVYYARIDGDLGSLTRRIVVVR
jgi:probable HAF family extracellular repeat protein